LEQDFASFLEWNFGLEFADPPGVLKIRQIAPENFWNLANTPAMVKINLYCNF
jgi:hypothetical protein